jgi:hypothetical protein
VRLIRGASAFLLAFCSLFIVQTIAAQRQANANAMYRQLRDLMPGGDVINVSNFEAHRDAATFTFRQGSFALYGEVNGKITGAVFEGKGHLHITPPTANERHNLALTMRSEELDEDFDQVVLRFTDGTADELRKASAGAGQSSNYFGKAALELRNFARTRDQLGMNIDLRLLEDVESPAQGGYFLAAVHGGKNGHLYFFYDPNGVAELAPEEVALAQWTNDEILTYPLAFHRAAEYASHTASGNENNTPYRVLHEDLDVTIEKNGFLSDVATVQIRAERDGVAVVPLDLYPTLRVSSATTDAGVALDYVQEGKYDDPEFGVVLAHPLNKGETATLKITYGGKDAVRNVGAGNYYPGARVNWFPNADQSFGNYATYTMLFHVPKGLQLIATGSKASESTDGKMTTTQWKSDVALPVVGFSLGRFTMKEKIVEVKGGENLTIDAFANTDTPDSFSAIQEPEVPHERLDTSTPPLGTINTVSMLPAQLSEGEVAARIYSHYFGQLPFSHVALTQQAACNYGQSWPMLVYLPICGFLDSTQQHFLELRPEDEYWKVVTPHEVAHQWWGQTVGFGNYRDQWMSEGFADASAAMFLQATRPKPDDFHQFWKYERRLLTEKNAQGFRPIDVGPVTMGFRLASTKTGWSVYQDLVYPKGAYILHMIREMMWTNKEGDADFMAMMHDFVKTYWLKPATTEDFKAMVEKHMTPGMDLDRNHKMDWFFNEYVYGTELPVYHFEGQTTDGADGTSLHVKLSQSGVSENFKMAVPIYLEFADGKVMRLGSANVKGSSSLEQTVKLGKLPSPVKRVLINYNYDVLCTEN